MFLALKNTPLAFLAGRSFDRVNALHRCCGFVTILFAILHSAYVEICVSLGQCSPSNRTYVYGLWTFGKMEQVLNEPRQYAGAVASLSMLLIFATAIGFVRRRQYELFYAIHVVMAATVLVAGTVLIIHDAGLCLTCFASGPASPGREQESSDHYSDLCCDVVHRQIAPTLTLGLSRRR